MTQLDLSEREEFESLKRRRSTDGEELRVRWSLVFQVIGYILGMFVMYNTMTNRQTALEVQMNADRASAKAAIDTMRGDLAEVKSDVKTLLRRKP